MSGEHYFTRNPSSPSKPRPLVMSLRGAGTLTLWTDRGVFASRRVDPGTRLLAETFEPQGARRVVDLGAGYGALGLALARRFPELEVLLVEINERAVRLCQTNIRANGLQNAVCVLADGPGVLASRSVDALVSNPPIRAGRALLVGWLQEAHRVLRPGGSVWLVVRTRQGAESLLRWMQGQFPRAELVERESGYRVLRARVG